MSRSEELLQEFELHCEIHGERVTIERFLDFLVDKIVQLETAITAE
jgi:hypothetical protein